MQDSYTNHTSKMELMQNIMADKATDLLGALTGKAGYTTEQADRFLPEAGTAVGSALSAQASELDLADPASASNIGAVLNSVDVASLANRTGVSAEQSVAGLNALLPMLLGFLGERAGGASGLLALLGSGKSIGGALGGVKDVAGRLFK